MVTYFGDYTMGATVYIPFNTFSSDDPSASVTITNLVIGDVEVHKNGGTTQRASDSGSSVTIDFDSVTGQHIIVIDTSDNTDANFFVPGADYQVRIEGTTVDGATINAWVGAFSIENRHSAGHLIATTIATLASQTSFTLTAGSADDNAYNGCMAIITDRTTAVQRCVGLISDYTGASKTVTLAADPGIFTMAQYDNITIIATAALANVRAVNGTLQTANDNGADINTLISVLGALNDAAAAGEVTEADTVMQYIKQLINILIGTAGIGTFPAEAAPGNGVSLAEVIHAIHDDVTGLNGDAMRGTDGANTTTPPTVAEIQTEMEENGASLLDTIRDNLGTPVALDGGGATIAGMLTKIADDNGGADFDAETDSLQAIRDRGDAAWVTGGGGSITDILNVIPLIPMSIDLANTATVRLGLMLYNALDDLPTTAEIDPGTIYIERKAIGGTSWSSVVSGAACSEAAGLVYYDEVFDSGSGYAEGDSIRIIFAGQKITVAANDYEISDATGRMFYTEIRQTMRGTDGANTTTPPTVSEIQTEMEENGASILDSISDLLPASTIAAATDIPTTAEIQTELEENGASILDTLQDRLTATRAGYLDQLDFALQEAIAALPTAAEIQTEMEENGASLLDTIRDDLDNATDGLGALKALIDGLNDISAADVNAQVLDVMNTDTFAEPGQGNPPATASIFAKINYLYKAWRNKKVTDASGIELYDDAGTTVDQKLTHSDDGTDYTKGEVVTGP